MHLKADHLIKALEGKTVVSDLSFEARAGYILGILGPDAPVKPRFYVSWSISSARTAARFFMKTSR